MNTLDRSTKAWRLQYSEADKFTLTNKEMNRSKCFDMKFPIRFVLAYSDHNFDGACLDLWNKLPPL